MSSVTSILPLSQFNPVYVYEDPESFKTINDLAQNIFQRSNGELTQIKLIDKQTRRSMRITQLGNILMALGSASLFGAVCYYHVGISRLVGVCFGGLFWSGPIIKHGSSRFLLGPNFSS